MKKTAVLFGASGGIGSKLAERLSDWNLFGVARDEQRLRASPVNHHLAGDASDFAFVERCFEEATTAFGQVDAAINCVGSIILKPAHLTTDKELEECLRQNLWTAFAVVRAGARAMMRRGGSIVLVSSSAAQLGLANHDAIAAAKGGVEALVRSAAAGYAGRNLRVNAVAPGLVDTPLAAKITSSEKALDASKAMHPLGRIGRPEQVASALAWLLADEQDWITGQVLGIDGGLARLRPR
ncbi:MAG: SDR family oxidoreductase [Candidatus Eremiobacteraeota bacterium]|nr:SDR family oxidoreductase [Candidatus Eremiobacteraeota bacterium]